MERINLRSTTLLLVLCFFTSSSLLLAQGLVSPPSGHAQCDHDHGHNAGGKIQFIENQNQWHSNIQYAAPLGGFSKVYLEDNAFTYMIFSKEQSDEVHDIIREPQEIRDQHMVSGHAYKVHFLNAQTPEFTGHDRRAGYNNYFLGEDPTKWASHVPVYQKVIYENLYEGIQLATYSVDGYFKYDFIVAPNADPNQIQLEYEGTDGVSIDKEGNLVIKTSIDNIVELKPYVYQIVDGKEVLVSTNYQLNKNILTFDFPEGYDTELPLIIDPTVIGATLSGTVGSSNYGHTATFDNAGNIYAGGISFGTGYPTTTGAFQMNFAGGNTDIAMSKYTPDASELVYATYLGGSEGDYPHSIVVDYNGQLCVYGSSNSADYPTTPNAVQQTFGGFTDIVITKFNADGTALVGSTFVGGSQSDGRNGSFLNSNYGDAYRGEVVIDDQGNIYIASCSSSTDFPVTPNAVQPDLNTGGTGTEQDGVVLKLNSDLSTMFYATYLGGSDPDNCSNLRVADFGEVYVTGFAGADDFPMPPGGFMDTWPGGEESGFIIKLSADGSAISKGTFFGSNDGGDEHSYFLDIDENNTVHIFGQTTGTIDVTPGTYFQNEGSRQFIAGFTPSLNNLVYSTVIGTGTGGFGADLAPVAFMVDKCNGIYFAGYNAVNGLPLTPDAIETTGNNFYVGVLEPNAEGLIFGTYYGDANHVDGGTSRFDKAGRVYQAVCSGSGSSMNTTPNAYATGQSTGWDIGVFKIDFDIETVTATALAEPSTSGCAPFTVDFTYTGQDAETIFWDFGTGGTSDQFDVTHTFNNPGTYVITQIVNAENTCNLTDTFYLQVDVFGNASTLTDTAFCQGQVDLFLDVSAANASYEWQDGTTGATYQVETTGIYWVDVSIVGCTRRDSFNVASTTPIAADLGEDQSLCDIFDYTIDATNPYAVSYLWQDGTSGSNFFVTETGDYWVQLTDSVGCQSSDTVSLVFAETPEIDLGVDLTICDGESTVLDATTPGATYTWQDGSTDPTLTVSTDGVYSVIVDVEGCTDVDEVEVNTALSTPIDIGTFDVLCDVPAFTLDVTLAGATGYEWSNGDMTPTTSVSTTGNYSVTVYDSNNCPSTDDVDLLFSTTPVINFNDTTICEGATVTFNANYPGAVYTWQDGSNDPFYTVTETGTYTVLADNNGCESSESVFVNYALNPGVEFETTDVLCADATNGQIATVFATGGNDLSFVWDIGSTDPDVDNLAPGPYDVTITNEWNCIYEETVVINSPPPIVYETEKEDVECPGDADGWIVVGNVSGGISPYLYGFAGEELSEDPIIRDIPGGDYELIVQDDNGCTVSQTLNIYEPPMITVDAGGDKYMKLGETTQIYGEITPTTFNQTIEWTPYDSLNCVNCIEPIAGPHYTTTYALTVNDTITGCTLRDTMTVFVDKPKNVFIPNAFSPNGDLQNDIFFINTDLSAVKVNYLRVFDRWGEILFEDINFPPNNPTHGYDGKLGGKFLNPQVLVYIAEIEFIDGDVKTYQGDVTLMR